MTGRRRPVGDTHDAVFVPMMMLAIISPVITRLHNSRARTRVQTYTDTSAPLCAHRGRNLGPDEHVGMPTVCKSGKKDLLGVER